MTFYAPYADTTVCAHLCIHCGQTEDAHHSTAQCYTTAELVARLRFAQREGRWPGPDEGCEEVDPGTYACEP